MQTVDMHPLIRCNDAIYHIILHQTSLRAFVNCTAVCKTWRNRLLPATDIWKRFCKEERLNPNKETWFEDLKHRILLKKALRSCKSRRVPLDVPSLCYHIALNRLFVLDVKALHCMDISSQTTLAVKSCGEPSPKYSLHPLENERFLVIHGDKVSVWDESKGEMLFCVSGLREPDAQVFNNYVYVAYPNCPTHDRRKTFQNIAVLGEYFLKKYEVENICVWNMKTNEGFEIPVSLPDLPLEPNVKLVGNVLLIRKLLSLVAYDITTEQFLYEIDSLPLTHGELIVTDEYVVLGESGGVQTHVGCFHDILTGELVKKEIFSYSTHFFPLGTQAHVISHLFVVGNSLFTIGPHGVLAHTEAKLYSYDDPKQGKAESYHLLVDHDRLIAVSVFTGKSTLYIWDRDTAKVLAKDLHLPIGFTAMKTNERCLHLLFHNGNMGSVMHWDLTTGEPLNSTPLATKNLHRIRLHESSQILESKEKDKYKLILNHPTPPSSQAFNPDCFRAPNNIDIAQ